MLNIRHMKKYILLFSVLFVTMISRAYDLNYAGCYKSVKVEYTSVDENNAPITLSELVTVPLKQDGVTKREVGFIILSGMPFTTEEDQASTGKTPLDGNILRTIATEGALCIQCDGQGFGSSKGKTLPFLVNKLTARQSIDGFLAALDYCNKNGIQINENYYTINAGFSLDGGHALAIQRYLEKYSSADEKAKVRLRRTICGGAPLNASVTAKYVFNGWFNDAKYRQFMEGFIKCNANGALHNVTSDEIFNKDNTIRQDVIDGTSDAGKAVWKALYEENMDSDWIPEAPITYIHWANDTVVPYTNAQLALKAWGHDKFNILNKDLTSMKWNYSLFKDLRDLGNEKMVKDPHLNGSVNFYTGMIDGCLRDTTIASAYAKTQNFYNMLTTVFDVASNLTLDSVDLDLGPNISNAKLSVNSLNHCHLTFDLNLGYNFSLGFDIVTDPVVRDSDAYSLKNIDAHGYLKLPATVKVSFWKLSEVFKFETSDLHNLLQSLTAVFLHRICPTEAEAKKYCDAINNYCTFNVVKYLGAKFAYTKEGDNYVIEPHVQAFNCVDLRAFSTYNSGIKEYYTLGGKKFKMGDYTVETTLTNSEYGSQTVRADITKEDGSSMGQADITITGVDQNDDGTLQTVKLDINADITKYHLQLKGSCNNLHDAILTGILCYGNLTCETEAQAQAYADAVNANIDLSLYLEEVGDDGLYPENGTYTYRGKTYASVLQEDDGTWYVRFAVRTKAGTDIPFSSVIKEIE